MSTQPYYIKRDKVLEETLQQHMSLYGYMPKEVPVIENADLFLTRAGDKIIDKLVTFERNGHQLSLRPEFTAPAARHYALNNKPHDIVRWQFRGSVFEDIPGQAHFERLSLGAELIGSDEIMSDAEIIAMATHGIAQLNIEQSKLVVGHVGLQKFLLSLFKLDSRTYRLLLSNRDNLKNPDLGSAYVMGRIDDILPTQDESSSHGNGTANTRQMLDVLLDSTKYGTTMGGRTRADISERLIKKWERRQEYANIVQAIKLLEKWVRINTGMTDAFTQIQALIDEYTHNDDKSRETAYKILQQWQQTLKYVQAYDIPEAQIYIEPNLAQNWEYYTGIVFGVRNHNDQLLLGGGRYDELIRIISGIHSAPAVGFAFYLDRIMEITSLAKSQYSSVLMLSYDNNQEVHAIACMQALHNSGIAVQMGIGGDIHVKDAAHIRYLGTSYDHIDHLIKTLKV